MEVQEAGTWLYATRKKAGMTQLQLAKKAGLPQTVISRIEMLTVSPRISELTALAKALGVTIQLNAVSRKSRRVSSEETE